MYGCVVLSAGESELLKLGGFCQLELVALLLWSMALYPWPLEWLCVCADRKLELGLGGEA